MTDLHEVAFAVSLTNLREWGTDVQVLLALAAEPAIGDTTLCYRELAKRTGLSTGTVSVVLKRLETRRVILRDPGRGREPSAWFVRPPEKWGLVPWRCEREVAIDRIALSVGRLTRVQTEKADLGSSRDTARVQTRSQATKSKSSDLGSSRGLTRAQRPVEKDVCSRDSDARTTSAPSLSSSSLQRVTRGELEGGREQRADISDREAELMLAFMVGAGLDEVKGSVFRRLRVVAAESNGTLPRLVELARDAKGPGLFLARLGQIEQAMVAPSSEPRHPYMATERERLEQHLEACRRAGLEEEAREAEQLLATLEPCESGSEL